MTNPEVEALIPEVEVLTLSNGLRVDVNRLKTRETLKLLKILTKGASYAMDTIEYGEDAEAFTQSLMIAVVFALPEAEVETLEFIQAMVVPSDLVKDAKSKAEKEVNANLVAKYNEALGNPELEDLVDILRLIITNEAPHIQSLGKKLGLLLKTLTPAKN